ncbi:unnamed protein product, partial [Closterium sp. Yama58-4]
DLSVNQLSGELRSSLANLQKLQFLSLGINYLYAGTLPTSFCSAVSLSLASNCFPSNSVPCGLVQTQQTAQQCAAFCGLSPPSAPPCAGRGYCYWQAPQTSSNATCACYPGFTTGASPAVCDAVLPESEWLALEALATAWRGYDGEGTWSKDARCANMRHITCDAQNHVVKLDVANTRTSGSMPELIGNLVYLTALNVGSNRFSGSLPTTFGRLTNLVTLVMGSNKFDGPLPDSISSLPKPELLSIGVNAFNGQIPEGLCKMTSLTA